ncbi:hypothetical protein FA10DRAFT_263337 [Acaromyces ingoldii]|uniref:Uncharacterized protein n=1 Tax=Acaromyces ingoldii TaxID=215250 RepID=A0A316YAZ3_9BASI|nr:hypothetical protein FA10DRAFT_263337 [Acaromyces ingoldii]PWN86479.1 hypothetical protein FA10DRAFT_263337 [Acaromyces ingoldii]
MTQKLLIDKFLATFDPPATLEPVLQLAIKYDAKHKEVSKRGDGPPDNNRRPEQRPTRVYPGDRPHYYLCGVRPAPRPANYATVARASSAPLPPEGQAGRRHAGQCQVFQLWSHGSLCPRLQGVPISNNTRLNALWYQPTDNRVKNRMPVIEIELLGVKARALVDTGAGCGTWESAEPDKRFNALARLGGGTAVSFEAYLITFSDLADWFDVI